MKRASWLLSVLLVALAACSSPAPPPLAAPPAAPSSTPAEQYDDTIAVVPYVWHGGHTIVTGAQKLACMARAHGMLPDPACTPGSVGSTNKDEICKPGKPSFSDAHRPPPSRMVVPKRAAMAAYNVPATDLRRTEYDHLIPLSLGGSDDVTNLWPQVSDTSTTDEHNSKDGVETRIWTAVCSGRVPLGQAQLFLARDWTAAEKSLGLTP